MDKKKQYVVVCYMRIDPEDPETMTLEEATHEMHGQAFIQPENIYRVEELEEATPA